MTEVFHRDPIEVHKYQGCDHCARYQAAIILVIFDPIQDPIPRVWHKKLANDECIKTKGKNQHCGDDKQYA